MSRHTLGWMVFWMVGCGSGTAVTPPNGGMTNPGPTEMQTPIGDNAAGDQRLVDTLTIGPIMLPAGAETTFCVTKRLNSDTPIDVSQISSTLAPGSHHLVVYRSSDTEEQLEPYECQPFEGFSDGTVPIYAAQSREQKLVFPKGVVLPLEAHRMVRIEAHFINASAGVLEGKGEIRFYQPTAPAADQQKAELFVYGNMNINLPIGAETVVGPAFHAVNVERRIFGLTTHTHKLGVGTEVSISSNSSDSGNQIYSSTTWDDPPTQTWDPGKVVAPGEGLRFSCRYRNTTQGPVKFGTSANDEMCFVFGYFYPATTFDQWFCFGNNCNN